MSFPSHTDFFSQACCSYSHIPTSFLYKAPYLTKLKKSYYTYNINFDEPSVRRKSERRFTTPLHFLDAQSDAIPKPIIHYRPGDSSGKSRLWQPSTRKLTRPTKTPNNLFGAFGALLGYIGAEATTVLSFERLLWPQRFLSGFTIHSAPQLALLHPMGGPLHTVGLKTMDTMFQHGLLKGFDQGHMPRDLFYARVRMVIYRA